MIVRKAAAAMAAAAALALACPCRPASAQIVSPPEGVFGEYRRLALEWWDEFNRFRMEQGLPSMVWSEKIYIVLVEYAKEIRKYNPDASGLPSPAERPTSRARRVHKWNISFMDNPSLSIKSIYSARESIERFGGVKLIRSIRDANQNAGAVAIVERNASDVYVVEAVSRLKVDELMDVQQKVAMANAILSLTDQAERVKAARDLAALKDVASVFVLIPLLCDKNAEVAREAIAGLDLIGDPCLIEPLINALDRVPAEMQALVAQTLAKLTGRKDLGADSAKWRKWLEQNQGTVAAGNEKPAEKTDLSDKEIDELVDKFNKDYRDADSIGKIDAIKSVAGVRDKRVAKALCPALGSKDPMVRKAAAEALRAQADKSATGALVAALAANEDLSDVAVAIIEALGETRDPRAVPCLTKDLYRPGQPEITTAKITALGKIKDKACIQALIDFMQRWGGGAREHGKAIRDALLALTGKDFGNDRDAWKGWWERTKNWFKFPEEKNGEKNGK